MEECIRGEGVDCSAFELKVRSILKLKTIAVVGMSPAEDRPSYRVGKYLLEHGYDVIPVRPGGGEILGQTVFSSLSAIGRPVDVVDVFRRSEDCEEIAREAIKIGARALWLQEGVISPIAQSIAAEADISFMMDVCIKKMHAKYIGE